MLKITYFRSWALILVALLVTGCAQHVPFESARLSSADPGPTRKISGLLSKPEGKGPFPAVVLLHTCGGMRPHVTEDWPRYLNGLGYVTLAVDSMSPRGLTRCDKDIYDLAGNPEDHSRDAYGALDYLASQPFVDGNRVGVMGFSVGGAAAAYFAGRNFISPSGLNFKAAVNLYGRCFAFGPNRNERIPMEVNGEMIPLIIIVGEKDQQDYIVAPCKSVDGKGGVRTHVLKDAYHAFDMGYRRTTIRYDGAGNPRLYSHEATERAKEIVKEFLAEHIGAPSPTGTVLLHR